MSEAREVTLMKCGGSVMAAAGGGELVAASSGTKKSCDHSKSAAQEHKNREKHGELGSAACTPPAGWFPIGGGGAKK